MKQKNPNPQDKGLVPVLKALGKSLQLSDITQLNYQQAAKALPASL